MQCTKLIISGHVQGVCFRQTAKEIADKMKLQGTVKNLATGDVEIIVAGDQNDAKTLLERIMKALPAGEVTSFTTTKITLETLAPEFTIMH